MIFNHFFSILDRVLLNSLKEPFATQWQVKGETAEFEQYDDFEAVELGGFVWTFGKFIERLTVIEMIIEYFRWKEIV